MSDYEQAVFISYAWGEETNEREAIVNQLDQSLQKRGLKIIRDKRDLGYKGMIREFMERIGESSCVIVVLSDKYLRSKNCMYELVEIAENKDFINRIFPIVLSDAKIYEALDRINYKKYWQQKKEELNQEILSLGDVSNITGISEELNDYDRFGDEFDKLTTTLKNMNSLSPDILRESDFQQLYDALVTRMSSIWDKAGKSTNEQEKKKMGNDKGKVSANDNSNVVGNISVGGSVSGNIVVGNNNQVSQTVNNGLSAADVKGLFDQIYAKVDIQAEVSPAVKEDVKAEIQDIQATITQAVEKNENVDESALARKFRNIARMTPDILEVIGATLKNPLGGIGLVVEKIAQKAREEAGS